MRLFNTLTRRVDEVAPVEPGLVKMYSCGPTVYRYVHLGNLRTFMLGDLIRRALEFEGYQVTQVMNITDVGHMTDESSPDAVDKMQLAMEDEGLAPLEIAEKYATAAAEDAKALGVRPADLSPKATEHIPEMIALIERLIGLGVAYEVDGDVYFEIRRFPPYGKLSGKNLDELLAGARVEVDERKRDPRDFALWKAAKPGEPSWKSPWGAGRPGWHIECSAMAMRYLGESFDLHGGGEDLIFPHHECEIAQAEAATGRPFSRYWVHNGFVNMGKEKMSKSLGNTLLIRELVKRHDADAIRLFFLGTHYRNPVEWSEERVQDSARAMERFTRLLGDPLALSAPATTLPPRYAAFRAAFEAAMDDDLNTPQALAALFELARALQEDRERASTEPASHAAFGAGVNELRALTGALGLFQRRSAATGPPPEVERLLAERVAARERRDFGRSDALRAEIAALGWAVEDTAAGPRLTRKDG
jgi:cysteinyl-tRNA synthetase